MYCLEKFQRELAYFLDIDLRDLPKVQEILQSQGYTAVKKNDEIIELGNGKISKEQVEKLREIVENNKSESVALSGRAYPQQQLTPFSNGETPSTSSLPSRVLDLGSIKESGLNKTKDKVLHLINKLRDILDKPIINHSSGLSGILTKSSLNKIASDKAVQKSIQNGFSKEEHFKSAEYIKELFENAILRTTHADSKGRESIEAVHRFVTPLKLNDKEANALITLLEKKQGNNKIYTIELEGLEANKEVLFKNADLIQTFTSRASESKAEWTRVANSTTNNLKWQQDGNVLRSVVELDNGEKLLLSKDRLENVYIQSNHIEQVNSYDELILQESLEKFAKDELENKLVKQIESKGDSVIFQRNSVLSVSEKSHSNISRDTSPMAQYDKVEAKADKGNAKTNTQIESKAGIAKLDSTQIQEQLQKEQEAQQKMAEHFANTQAKRDEIIALKEAKLGLNADEVPLDKGQDILYKPIRDTSIVLNDETAPFEAEFVIVKLSDIKPNFDNTNTQGRLIKQESVIENIINDFKPELIFYQEGGVNGVPIITRDGKVVAGNHRSEALKQILNAQTHNAETAREAYKKNAKEFLGVELENDEIIVRRLKEHISDKQILQLAFSSNIGRESTMGEKALSTLSLYRQNIATLPKALSSENVNELKSLVAKHLDKQGNGLNTFEPNLALLTSLARNGKNSNILQSLDSIKGNSEYKNKIINMYVDNAGSFYNLAHNPSFKSLEFRDILSDAIYYTANQNPTREVDYTQLINDIEAFLNLAKDEKALQQALILDSNKVQNLTAQAFGLSLAKFSRQENPSSALYECLKEAPKALELATQPTFFTEGKALSEIDVYDFLEYLINQGQVTQSQSVLSSLMPRLRELRESIANPQSSVSKVESSIEATSQISKEIKDIIDSSPQKGRDMQIIGEANFTPQVVEYAHKNNKKVAIDKLSQAEAEQLGYKYPNDVRVTIDYSAINHTLNRHGAESALVKNSGQKAVDYTDIAEYRNIVKGADESLDSVDNMGTPVVVSYKQINGHFVVVEEIRKGQNELNFKTMFKQEGNYKDSESYKKTSQSSNATEGYEPTANSFALTKKGYKPDLPTQTTLYHKNLLKAQSEYFNSLTNEYEKIKEIKKLHTQDDNLIRVMKVDGRNDYIEPLSNMSVSKEYLQKQTAQSLKENITQAILGNQTQLKALQQGYNTYHLSPFQKEILESVLDIANNPTKLKEYKLQGLQKQLDNLNNNEAYHIEKSREYDKARYAKDREELEKEIYALKGTESSLESAPQKVDSSDIIFTDKKGKEHTLTKEVQEQWLKTFNLKSLDESYIPQLPQELQEAIGKEIRLTKGSLYKIIEKGREKYIPQIKETLEKPQIVLQDESEFIFAKQIKDDLYLTSIGKDFNTHITIISNSPKTDKTIQNKLKNGKVIYEAKNAEALPTSGAFTETNQVPFSKDIIPQQTLESTMKKFNYDEKKAKDLLEWHKDSSPLTKDENGLPKVFYHGSETDKPFEVFLNEKDQTKWGFWFSSNADDADLYAMARGNQAGKHGYEVFLKAKNIFDFNDEKNLEVLKKIFSKEDYEFMLDTLQKWGKDINVFNMLRDTNFDRYRSKAEVFKNELKKLGYDGIKELGDTIVVFDSNQIKHIDNKGVDGKFFNESSPNIYQSNAHIGSGLVGGSVVGIESDENGNVSFSPEKFALGFLGGAVGSKAVAKGFTYLKNNPKLKEAVARELADTLAQGFDKAKVKYPLLSALEPRYIIQNEKGRIVQARAMLKELEKKEQKGIYNVAYNGKNAVLIQKDLRAVDEALKLTQGYHLEHSQKGKGAKHIKIEHLQDSTKEGYVTDLELVNLGKDLRTFLKDYEPFVEKQKSGQEARIYEWENKEGVRFRLVSKIQGGGTTADSHLESAEEIITFYSDRNLKDKMEFKNPILKVQEKFKFNPQKAKDLLEWHKDSHPLTKDENGVPKVFYHGGKEKDLEIFEKQSMGSGYGFWLTLNKKEAELYRRFDNDKYLVSSFIKAVKTFKDNITPNRKQEIKNIFGDDITDDVWHKFQILKKEFDEAKKQIKRKGYNLMDIEYNAVNLVDKNGDAVTFKEYPYSQPTRLLDSQILKKMGLSKMAKFLNTKQTDFISGDIDLLMGVINKTDYSTHKDYLQNKLRGAGFDSIQLNDNIIVVFDSNQIKHIDNKGVDGKFFNESSPNIYQSNAHLGSGLVGGSVAGIESDENGNIVGFNPAKFALGLLGGAVGSKAISSGYKRFLEKKPQRIIPLINKQKYTEPRFEVTKELEKTYRNAQVKPNEKIKDTLGLSGVVKGDFVKLAQKHPEYFANPQEAKDLCDYVFQNAFIGLQASDKKQALIIAKLQDSNNDYGSVAFRIQNINGEHRIRSVILMEQKQVDLKIQNAKKLGEPIFHFW